MLDSLARIDRMAREMDRLLGPEPQQSTPSQTDCLRYRDDPVGFIRNRLGEELEIKLPDGSLVTYQADVARALVDHDYVTVKSGQKTGKSYLAVRIAVWWCATRPDGRVIITSSSWEQVKDPLWREMWELHRSMTERGLPEVFPAPALDPSTGVRWPDGRTIRGISTDKPTNAAGKSGSGQLFILDEASGIKQAIADALMGNTLGGGKMFCISNPTDTAGFFYETFTSRREFWHQFTLSARQTPNYLAGKAIVPGLATREAVEQLIAANGGEGTPWVQVRVDGDFPTQADNAVISLGAVQRATARWRDEFEDAFGELVVGVDVARFGSDDSVAMGRRGEIGYSPKWIEARHGVRAAVNGYDYPEVAGMVVRVVRALHHPGETVRIQIDAAGGYGGGVANELRRALEDGALPEFTELIEVNVAERASRPDDFPQLRDELWFDLRDWLKTGCFATDEKLEAELVAPVYTATPRGQYKVADKAALKKILKRSPDRADAFALACHDVSGYVAASEGSDVHTSANVWATEARGFG